VFFERHIQLYHGDAIVTVITSDLISKAVFELDCSKLYADGLLKKHAKADVATCKVCDYKSTEDRTMLFPAGVSLKTRPPPGASIMGLPITGTRKIDDVHISNDIFLFGYPSALG
jgi:hypothetical protein